MINLGLISEGHTIGFDCTLPASAERTWFYLTKPEGLRAWLADGAIESRPRGNVKLRFRNDEALVRSNCGVAIRGVINRYEPYRALAYSWIDASQETGATRHVHTLQSASIVTFELAGRERHTWMSLAHTGLPAHVLSNVGAGWYTHLKLLIVALQDEISPFTPASFPGMSSLYERQATMHMDVLS